MIKNKSEYRIEMTIHVSMFSNPVSLVTVEEARGWEVRVRGRGWGDEGGGGRSEVMRAWVGGLGGLGQDEAGECSSAQRL